jgi:hypothetical protein
MEFWGRLGRFCFLNLYSTLDECKDGWMDSGDMRIYWSSSRIDEDAAMMKAFEDYPGIESHN